MLSCWRLRANTAPADDAQLRALLARIAASVARIEARGGRVYLVHLEACGKRRVVENVIYPEARYWNRLTEIPGIRIIESDDYAEIANLPCHDGSHIDARDAAAVTHWLARVITARP